ncbi:MAG TPA: hypothetical protein VGE01_07485, partial [Fimbriimonas sp.]
ALATVTLLRTPPTEPAAPRESQELAAALIAAHDEAAVYTDVTGAGLTRTEVVYGAATYTHAGMDWSEVDVDSL